MFNRRSIAPENDSLRITRYFQTTLFTDTRSAVDSPANTAVDEGRAMYLVTLSRLEIRYYVFGP